MHINRDNTPPQFFLCAYYVFDRRDSGGLFGTKF